MVVNEQTGFRSTAVAGALCIAVCNCLDAGRFCGSLPLRCHVRVRMARAGGCLSEHVGLVNYGGADGSRGLHTRHSEPPVHRV